MIDKDGYRLNVGIIVMNEKGQVLLAERLKQENAWQFPQGGIDEGESPKQAMYRELLEELGLEKNEIELLAESEGWLSYDIPKQFRRYRTKPLCVGQKQKWFLCQLTCDESCIRLDYSDDPEFGQWTWVDYWYPLEAIIAFKRPVYQRILEEFSPLLEKVSNPK